MIDKPGFVLCYIKRDHDLLMIHRNKAPNKGLWNCVGGHIEPGEIAEAACLREVFEETGFKINQPVFHGILTWEGFEIPSGGLYMFSIDAPYSEQAVQNDEGDLAWKPIEWVLSTDEVVDNLRIVTPHVLNGDPLQRYHFVYQNGRLTNYEISDYPQGLVYK